MDFILELEEPQEANDAESSCGSMCGAGFDARSLSQEGSTIDFFNDEGLDIPVDDLDGSNLNEDRTDEYLQHIKDAVEQRQYGDKQSIRSAGSSGSTIESPQIKTSDQYLSVPYGLIPRATYEHGKRSTNIMGVTYNGRMRQFIIIDSKGITAWKRDAVDHRVTRSLLYPKYEYGVITNIIYAKKYNCYFVLGKDFSLKVYNRDFYETCSVSADLRSVLFMLFNPVRDELITGGVGGTKVWRFHQQSGKSYTELKPLANYGLSLKYELPNVGGSWVKKVELDYHLEHLYCCSDTDLHVYDLAGKLLFKFERAHMMSITGCRYSRNASVLVTSSIDSEVKVWSLMGGLVHTFRGHSRAVTNLTLHPFTSSIVITCSLDGTVRMWSLDTMDMLYTLVVSTDGVMWMGLTDDNLLFISTQRAITLWNLNYSVQFWAMARSNVCKMSLVGCKGKTTRLMALLHDNSVRIMARSNRKNLCTVLPPPNISPLQRVMSVCYSRQFNVIFILINPHQIWVYTTRTDPSCRIAVWDVLAVQSMSSNSSTGKANQETFDPSSISVNKPAPVHRATESGAGNEPLANCCCTAILNSTAILWTDEGCCCPIRDSYLLMGLEDGCILFMDPVIKGHKYLEFKTGKDPVLDMTHDMAHGCLTTVHKLKDMMQILVWSLPDLELQHEVFTSMDLRTYTRLGYTMVTGHESGCVLFNPLEMTHDSGLNKPRNLPLYAEVIDINHKPEHLAPVIGMDMCFYQKIVCSSSNDGAIKIWNEDGALMTEIMLDSTLTSVCFLNNIGDLLVGFQKQIFYIDHTKVCPQLSVPDSDVDGFDKESFICEDPAVLYEGVTTSPDPITLESYLVPFDIEFSKDFLEGRVKLEPESVKEEESDDESEISMAPTDTYLSPLSTPRSDLSQLDLTLGSEVSKYDLLKQMKKTLAYLDEKEMLEREDMVHQHALNESHRIVQARRRRKMLKQGLLNVEDLEEGVISTVEEANQLEGQKEVVLKFEFPKFGVSPGPTPESSSPSTPQNLSESEDESEMDEPVQPEIKTEVKIPVFAVEPDEISKFLESSKAAAAPSPRPKKLEVSSSPRKKFGLGGITVDAASLMKEGKKTKKVKEVSHTSAAPITPQNFDIDIEESEAPRKEKNMKKRMSLTARKLPKSRKANTRDEKLRPTSPPSTQMEALELKEQSLGLPEKKVPEIKAQNINHDSSMSKNESKATEEIVKKQDELNNEKAITQDKKLNVSATISVPSLPSVPVESDKLEQRSHVVSSSDNVDELKASLVDRAPSAKRTGIDFSGLSSNKMQLTTAAVGDTIGTGLDLKHEDSIILDVDNEAQRSDMKEIIGNEMLKDDSKSSAGVSRPTTVTADSGIHLDRMSTMSVGSEEVGRLSLHIDLPSSEITDHNGSVSRKVQQGRAESVDSSWMGSELVSVSRTGHHSTGDKNINTQNGQEKVAAISAVQENADQEHTNDPDKETIGGSCRKLRRPYTSMAERSLGKPELDDAVKFFRQRPHTAKVRFQTADLQEAFDTTLERYKTMARTPLVSDKLHKNDDQAFSENWHERQIERHMLIRMQKELRAQSAKQRRHLMEQKKLERFQQQQSAGQRNQIPQQFHPYHYQHSHNPSLPQRSTTVHGSRPAQTGPTPTPVSSRPHTSTGVREATGYPKSYISIQSPFHSNLHHHQQQQQSQQEQEVMKREKSELSQERNFRFRMREKEVVEDEEKTCTNESSVDLWAIDPRNPQALRPRSRRSIPSKCHRYVLVTKPKIKLALPLPSPLEEELLASRFPDQGEKVYKKYEGLLYKPPRRPMYGIEYTPFQMFHPQTDGISQ